VDSHAKTTGSYVALCVRNSGAESGRELFKGLKDVESLLVCTRKNFLLGDCGYFESDIISGWFLGHLGPFHLALSPNQ